MNDEVSLVITSCGRFDLLEETLDSFFKYNTYPIKKIIITEDSTEGNKLKKLVSKYENQNFYMAEIPSKADSNYTISYQGIDIKGLVLKVGVVNNSDLAMIEDMVVNLIEVSDKRIVEDEARAIYAGLLSDIKEDKLSNSAKYKNGITYSVKIEKTGALIFSAQ